MDPALEDKNSNSNCYITKKESKEFDQGLLKNKWYKIIEKHPKNLIAEMMAAIDIIYGTVCAN